MKKMIAIAGLMVAALADLAAADVSKLESGTYFAQGSMFSRSYRVVARRGDRLCVKIANGPPSPYEGFQATTISTIAQRQGKAIVTATNAELVVKGPQTFVIGSGLSGEWQLATQFGGDLSAELGGCLTGRGDYAKTVRGPFSTGMIYPNVAGNLVTMQPKARVNVRQNPGEKSAIDHYGLAGDKVMLMASDRDPAQQIWYQVKFVGSGAEGWVRGDFVRAPGRPAIAPAKKTID